MGRPLESTRKTTINRENDDLSVLEGSLNTTDDERIIYFAGEVSEGNVSAAIAAMFGMAKRDASRPIYLTLETYGGATDSMFSLYDAIKFVPCPVHTIAMGKVMSAGVLILAAGQKGHRMIAPHARIMTHPAWAGLVGNIFEIKHELNEMARQEEQWIDAMVRETNLTAEKVRELNSRTFDTYLTPDETIELGIADRLLYELPHLEPNNRKTVRNKT